MGLSKELRGQWAQWVNRVVRKAAREEARAAVEHEIKETKMDLEERLKLAKARKDPLGQRHDAETDDTAARKAAAEGWGWDIAIFGEGPTSDGWRAQRAHGAAVYASALPALLDAIEAREIEAAEGRGWMLAEIDRDAGTTAGWVAVNRHDGWNFTRDSLPALLTAIHEAEASAAEALPTVEQQVLSADVGTLVADIEGGEHDAWLDGLMATERNGAKRGDVMLAITLRKRALAEPADLPLAGLVLSGGWRDGEMDSSTGWHVMRTVRPGGVVLWHLTPDLGGNGAWLLWRSGAILATGIGTRDDALNEARRLGAVVRGE